MGCWCGHRPWHYYGYDDDFGWARGPRRPMGRPPREEGDDELRADIADIARELRKLREEIDELRGSHAEH